MLLIEAGGKDLSPNIKIPAAFANQFKTKLDWEYYTEPEPHVDGRELYIPRGKSLGGSSSMNAMLYVRGRPLDYALWEEEGATGWGWDDVLPVLHALRAQQPRGARSSTASDGELVVSEQRSPRPVNKRLLAASRGRGHPLRARLQRARAGRLLDVPGQPAERPALERGRRLPAARARPANLEVATGRTVLGVEVEGGRAVGVKVRDRFRREHSLRAGPRGDPRRRARSAHRSC